MVCDPCRRHPLAPDAIVLSQGGGTRTLQSGGHMFKGTVVKFTLRQADIEHATDPACCFVYQRRPLADSRGGAGLALASGRGVCRSSAEFSDGAATRVGESGRDVVFLQDMFNVGVELVVNVGYVESECC